VIICAVFPGDAEMRRTVRESLEGAGVEVAAELAGAEPNAPREDVFRLGEEVTAADPDMIVVIGGGSTIDAGKAAEVLRTLGGSIDQYFGTGLVTQALAESGKKLKPVIAVQTAASSGAHLTKYSNITDVATGQKKLIVDDAIVPSRAVFQYDVTTSMPPGFTADGALDGISHCIEVFFGAVGKDSYARAREITTAAVGLIVNHVEQVVQNPNDREGREALGLATDLGGYAIMIGGTSGAHLTSFSLVDILSHGRACGLMNPYYMVFYAPAIEEPLREVGRVFQSAGLIDADLAALSGRDLGMAVAEGMMTLSRRIGFPTTLQEVKGFTDGHIERSLTAAKNPQLRMKLENMPVPLTAELVDEYMGSVLQAAKVGDLSLVKNVA
jgi:alcohol dehydrogenase class IV